MTQAEVARTITVFLHGRNVDQKDLRDAVRAMRDQNDQLIESCQGSLETLRSARRCFEGIQAEYRSELLKQAARSGV
jgi:hypothetical protein